ncbi:MAG TPA: putative glycoside hydrolase [Thermomicrobiales bacterium]|nr:putative glycoside hydrolase [Thermomicrobiales bacterium]
MALLFAVATVLWHVNTDRAVVELAVRDSSSGDPVPGALVTVESLVYRANENGIVRIGKPRAGTSVVVDVEGYAATTAAVNDDTSTRVQHVTIRPSSLTGRLTDRATGAPVAAATLALVDPQGAVLATTDSDEQGQYRFTDVPEDATLRIDAGAYGSVEEAVGQTPSRDFAFVLTQAQGSVLDEAGKPIQGATIRSGDISAVTGGDGTYTLEGVGNGAEVTISASGFETVKAATRDGRVAEARLQRQLIKGIYANWSILTTPGGLDDLIGIANTTEVNAIVIDIKQDTVYYDSQVPFFRDAGTVNPIMDVNAILNTLKDNSIYAIARLVVFQDPLVAEARPDLAVKDADGGLWVNEMGVAWVNAFNEELWDANIALATEATRLGFDEIQYDYVRFPSDGDLSTAEFGREYTAEAREAAITAFMKRSYTAIHGEGGRLAADLFGFVTIVDDEQYIGQRFSALEPYLDYVCMMIYPSHFSEGNIASAPGHPNDYPYETILESLQRAEQNVPGSGSKFRPWLQDFSYGYNGLRDYTKEDIRAQIDAAEEFGASGWLLWGDPFNVTVEALRPETGA